MGRKLEEQQSVVLTFFFLSNSLNLHPGFQSPIYCQCAASARNKRIIFKFPWLGSGFNMFYIRGTTMAGFDSRMYHTPPLSPLEGWTARPVVRVLLKASFS